MGEPIPDTATSIRHVRVPPAAGRFDVWRSAARRLLGDGVSPERVVWSDATDNLLPGFAVAEVADDVPSGVNVPKAMMSLLRLAAHHRSPHRWSLMYRLLWRSTHGERHLLDLAADPDVREADSMAKAVRRDIHKTHAFVRFRKTVDVNDAGGTVERYVSFHRPDHLTLPLSAPFFRERFGGMRWAILTPDASVRWDGPVDASSEKGGGLTFGPGVEASAAPSDDVLEDLWRTYYAHIFNPARIKLKAMRREMPVRHWPTLPETSIIPELLEGAPERVERMMASAPKLQVISAADFLPPDGERTVERLRDAAAGCRGCPLWQPATQTVFGEGPVDARVVFVGEQPGDTEDRAGRPFVGPAGRLMDELLAQAGVDRSKVYVTNAVKHFKFEPRGLRRIHAKPGVREVRACRPWLEAELGRIKPQMLVCLGSTAAQSLLGPTFRVTQRRGEVFESEWARKTMATIHPSAILRIPDDAMREAAKTGFVDDLRRVARELAA